jgi:hypothetical protein
MIPMLISVDILGMYKAPYLSIPEMGGQVVCPLAKLKSDDFMHN